MICVVAWLALSYWPAGAAALPTIAFRGAWSETWLPLLMTATLAVCIAIQAWLVYATVQSLRKPADAVQAATLQQFRLDVSVEAWWTVAPLAITTALGLFIVFARG
jgi:heme/copper-type cytochrome/quinol oxidase subunit 2